MLVWKLRHSLPEHNDFICCAKTCAGVSYFLHTNPLGAELEYVWVFDGSSERKFVCSVFETNLENDRSKKPTAEGGGLWKNYDWENPTCESFKTNILHSSVRMFGAC